MIARYARDPSEFDELLQDVRIRAWKGRARYSGRGTFAAWLARLCANIHADMCRRRRAEHRRQEQLVSNGWLLSEATPPDQHEAAATRSAVRCQRVQSALESLSAADRDLAVRRWIDNEKPAAIARGLRLGVASLCTRLWKLKQRLEKILGDCVLCGD